MFVVCNLFICTSVNHFVKLSNYNYVLWTKKWWWYLVFHTWYLRLWFWIAVIVVMMIFLLMIIEWWCWNDDDNHWDWMWWNLKEINNTFYLTNQPSNLCQKMRQKKRTTIKIQKVPTIMLFPKYMLCSTCYAAFW